MLDAYDAPWDVIAGIAALALLVAFAWVKLAARAEPAWRRPASWLVLTVILFELLLGANGVLRQWDRRPPPMLALMVTLFAGLLFASRRLGPKFAVLPYAVLIGLQVFRFPLELVMHRAAATGIMPIAMSYSGYNFDVLSGISAGVVGWLAQHGQAPRWLLWAWNVLGSVLLLIIIAISLAASPVTHAFGYDQMNTWVAYPPFVLLPGILVPAAAFGHLVLWRKLWDDSDG